MKKKCFIMAVLVTVLTVMPVNAVLVTNGGFDLDAADWGYDAGGGANAATEETTGGNPGGYVTIEAGPDTWAVWYQIDGEKLSDLGIPEGTVVTYQCDMIDLGSDGLTDQGGFKAESWAGTTKLTPGDGVDVYFDVTSTWETYSFDYTMESGTDTLKFVLVNVTYDGSGLTAKYGFDNASIILPDGKTPALRPVPSVGAGIDPAATSISWENPDPAFTAVAYLLESDTLLTEDPNLGPDFVDTNVQELSVDSESGYESAAVSLSVDKHYYWAVHVIDPNDGGPVTIPGFTWYFQTFDAPPTDVSAGADKYLWLTMDDGTPTDGKVTFELTGTYTDDGESNVDTTWALDEDLTETDPTTVVTIDTPGDATTTVTIDNTGWFYFDFTVSDDVGSASDTVNVGVYVDACEAANEDPDDIPATYPNGHGDIDGDCDTDMDDFVLLAASWLECMSEKLDCTP
jgi:hypothetical protein